MPTFLSPDVTMLLDDPELGYVTFRVQRKTARRVRGSVTVKTQTFQVKGNIQPATKGFTQNEREDAQDEQICIRSTFIFQTGNQDENARLLTDEVLFRGLVWRVTRIENWKDWGFTIAYATRVRE